MTTYYVSNSTANGQIIGSDTNDGMSPSTPFLTVNKGSLSLGVTTGDQCLINPGTPYHEDTGSGYLNLGKQYVATVTLGNWFPNSGNVIVSGVSGTIDTQINQTTNNMIFNNITFQGTLTQSAFRFGQRAVSGIVFNNCSFISTNSNGAHAIDTAGGTCNISNITFNNCNIIQPSNGTTAEGLYIQTSASAVYSNWTFNYCTGLSSGNNVMWMGQGTYTINGGRFSGAINHGIYLGQDGTSSSFNATATLNGCYVGLPAAGHAIIFGAGALNCVATRCWNAGTSGDSWVLKTGQAENNNHNILDCFIGATTGVTPNQNLIFKGGSGTVVQRNVIYVSNPLNGYLVANYDSAGAPYLTSNCNFSHNYIIARGGYSAILWSASGDAVTNPNNYIDYNTYEVWGSEGSGYGSILGAPKATSLQALQAQWGAYTTPAGNDSHSVVAMSQIQYTHSASGVQLYFQIFDQNGWVWNGTNFEMYTPTNWLNYSIPMFEHPIGCSRYVWPFPSNINAGKYIVKIFYAPRGWGYQIASDVQVNLTSTNSGTTYDWLGFQVAELSSVLSKLNYLTTIES